MDKYQNLFNEISNYDIKKANVKELRELSSKIREYIIKECSINGGHLASNLGIVELTIALHRAFSFPEDKLLFDVSHQCYTHKILSGRSLENLRQENGVDGFQKRHESKYDPYEAGHSSTSISTAMGMALARDMNNQDYHIISLIGDSSIANGMAFEALNNNDKFNHKVIIIINDNNMSIDQPVGALHNMLQNIRLSPKYIRWKDRYRKHMEKNKFTQWLFSFTKKIKDGITHLIYRDNFFGTFGYYYIGDVDGYDFKEMEHAFKKAKKKKSSVVIHVSTIKGKGYNLAETSNVSSWHSVPPFNIEDGSIKDVLPENKIKLSKVIANKIEEELSKDPNSILITASTSVGSNFDTVIKNNPEQALDVGISEEHAVTFASGCALNNKHTFVSMYSTFLQRSYDQINHDVARMDLPVTFLIDRSGLVGKDGETHQGIFDESFLLNMPNMNVCMGKDEIEYARLIEFSRTFNHPLAIRYPILESEKTPYYKDTIEYGKWKIEKEANNKDICIISYGPKLKEVINSFDNVTIVNAIFQSPLDEECLKSLLEYKNIIIYSPYGIEQGFTYHTFIKLMDLGYKNRVNRISLPNKYISKGTIEQQEKRCHIDISSLKELINSIK